MEYIEIAGGLYFAALLGAWMLAQAEHWLIWGIGSGVVGGLFLGCIALLVPELSSMTQQTIQTDTMSQGLIFLPAIWLSVIPLFTVMGLLKPR